ncbi:acyl-CoA dehydrogenase family protein [Enhygromyxa salina]|uniref:acyl-CoA dehydrogenase family protein n=1 Tax=Enhygromyxa salina TaxID=215803 RepID=UPI0011B24A30|nr:acyl-CoA dehydrogenase family protein [Enhygromyxa salina]
MSDSLTDSFEALLRRDPNTPAIADVDAWWQTHVEVTDGASPAAAAVLGGFAADRLAYAFASGYAAALRQLIGPDEAPRRRALCASESEGAHPSKLRTTLTLDEGGGGSITGDKSFATLGHLADELLVVAVTGQDEQGRNRLRVARIPPTREGVSFGQPVSPTFVPELPHVPLSLREVRVEPEELIPGDGYLSVLKPFRTLEDAHVFLAVLGWLTKIGRHVGWPDEFVERGLGLIAGLTCVAASPSPLSPAVHRVLGGLLAASKEHIVRLESSVAWQALAEEDRVRWARDRRLLEVAGQARAARLQAARDRPQ